MPASRASAATVRPSVGCDRRRPTTPRATNCGDAATSEISSTGATHVSAPASQLDPLVTRSASAKAATNAARIRSCAASSSCRRRPAPGSPRAPHRLAKNFASIAPTANHFPSDPAYVAVTGIPAGQDVVTRLTISPPSASCSSMANDVSHSTPSATETSRYAPRPVVARPASAAVTGQRRLHAAGRGIGHGGSRQRRRTSDTRRAHGQEATHRQVVDVVPGPLRRRPVLAVATRRAVDHARDCAPRLRRSPRPSGRRRRVGSSRPRRQPLRPVTGTPLAPPHPSGPPAPGACHGARCRRSTAGRSARHRPSAPARPSPPARRSRPAGACSAPPARPSRGRAR